MITILLILQVKYQTETLDITTPMVEKTITIRLTEKTIRTIKTRTPITIIVNNIITLTRDQPKLDEPTS